MAPGLWQPFVALLVSWPALRGITLSFTYSPAKGANHLHFVPADHALNETATILDPGSREAPPFRLLFVSPIGRKSDTFARTTLQTKSYTDCTSQLI